MTKNKTYMFHRPYCSPSIGYVAARSAKKAVELVHAKYGYADKTTATPTKPEGVL